MRRRRKRHRLLLALALLQICTTCLALNELREEEQVASKGKQEHSKYSPSINHKPGKLFFEADVATLLLPGESRAEPESFLSRASAGPLWGSFAATQGSDVN